MYGENTKTIAIPIYKVLLYLVIVYLAINYAGLNPRLPGEGMQGRHQRLAESGPQEVVHQPTGGFP